MATIPVVSGQSIADLIEKFEEFAAPLVRQGQFPDNAAVLSAAMTALQRESSEDKAKRTWLEDALEAGFTSGHTESDVFAKIRERHGFPLRVL